MIKGTVVNCSPKARFINLIFGILVHYTVPFL